ncbi:hypothetical protein KP509_37G018500 [Ceratopteris richardii]|nr:hypothetical protein KP509_37G018500 [Ceratopteris richardii]
MHRHKQSNRRQGESWIEDDFVTYDQRFQEVLKVQAPVKDSTDLRPQTGEASEDQERGISTQPMGPKVPRETPVNEAVEFTAGLNSSSRKSKAESTPMILHAFKQNEAVSTAERTEYADSINERVSDDRGSVLRAHEGKIIHGLLESNSETVESSNAMDTEDEVENDDRKKIDETGQKDGAERQKRVSKGRRILAPTFSQIKRSLLSRSRRGASTSPNRPISPRITFLSGSGEG